MLPRHRCIYQCRQGIGIRFMTEELEEQLTTIEAHSLCQLARCSSTEELEQWRVAVMGRRGKLTVILRSLPNLDLSTRPVIGALANQTKVRLEAALDKRKYFLLNHRLIESLLMFFPSHTFL